MALLLQYVPDTYPLMVLDGKGDAYMNMENFHGRNWRAIMVFTSEIRFPCFSMVRNIILEILVFGECLIFEGKFGT